ncbi:hypothetical protein JHK82_056631 [Glycine max]|uniref:Uncharacterized protein n=1 Tax=Glycine soja TaxID=3848 RepID=A0A445F684_GLYSO|nr:hypothetical protein JHK87_056727 [Glycine soja]KAG5077936.1 hypothetical protein JHK82_056631 [Glycine max]KAH1036491.1 hypothetical protein GYH30_056102 [Glycine max]RZB44280.1 hypothetical protein D0Y65_054340 [Glycine soja]
MILQLFFLDMLSPGGVVVVQILLVVANILMRILKAKSGKVPCERHLNMSCFHAFFIIIINIRKLCGIALFLFQKIRGRASRTYDMP